MGHFSGRSDWWVSMCAFRSLKIRPQSGKGQRPFSFVSSSASMVERVGLCWERLDRIEEIDERRS